MRARDAEVLAAEPRTHLDRYLARLDAALAGVPAPERREILLETRSHVVEQTHRTPARAVDDVLAELGAPEVYAGQFLPDEPTPVRVDDQRGSETLRGLAQLTAAGPRAIPLLLLFAVGYAVAGLVLLFVVAELADPRGTGVFVHPRPAARPLISVLMGGDVGGRDVLGSAVIPLGLLIVAAVHLALRAVLRVVLRRRLSGRRR